MIDALSSREKPKETHHQNAGSPQSSHVMFIVADNLLLKGTYTYIALCQYVLP